MTNKMFVCGKCDRRLHKADFFFHIPEDHPKRWICRQCMFEGANLLNPSTFSDVLLDLGIPYSHRPFVKYVMMWYDKRKNDFHAHDAISNYVLAILRTGRVKQQTVQETLDSFDSGNGPEIEAMEKELLKFPSLGIETIVPPVKITPTHKAKPAKKRGSDTLSDDDIRYLVGKWGSNLSEEEMVSLERMYVDYSEEFDLDADRSQTLKALCKTYLRMEEALDANDVANYAKLASVYDQLRKSGKFTESQKEKKADRPLDSIGELVFYCESHEGIIPQFPSPIEKPNDKEDIVINDMKAYIARLVRGEPHLDTLIDSYIKKLNDSEERFKERRYDDNMDVVAQSEGEVPLDDSPFSEEDFLPFGPEDDDLDVFV